jgi:hypothetical protein
MQISRSARLYRERKGRALTQRGPAPTASPDLNAIHALQLVPPLPLPGVLLTTTGSSPDRGATAIWPGGVDGETVQ